jgi:RNA polymerase sigma-70 factor, ECF subfamily
MDTSGYMVERASPKSGTPKGGTLTRTKAHAGDDPRTLDDAAFRAFYHRHARAVWSYLYRALGNVSQADDVTQEAFCRFLTAPVAEFDESDQRAYVFRIAGNLAIDLWRRQRREQAAMERVDRAAEGVPGAQPSAQALDLSRTFGELKPQERALLWLAYVEESAHDEIAASLGLAPKSIRVLLFRARRKLASLLRQRGIGNEGAGERRHQ